MTGAGALVPLLLAATVHLQPGAARPGDAVLVTVRGAQKAPAGTLGTHELTFLEFHGGWQALTGLSVEQKAGALPLSVVLVEGGEKKLVEGTLDVLEADFPRRELSVGKRFLSPSKKEQAWAARDTRAFAEAFDVDSLPFAFSGRFAWPRPPVVTAPFGDLRLMNGKKKSQHFGTDLDGNTGDPVYAAQDGEVVMVRECFSSGNTVLLHHGGRLFTAYFHLSGFEVKEGQAVRRGAMLGRVGKTGRVTGPHLHWGAKVDGRWVDPASLLGLDFD